MRKLVMVVLLSALVVPASAHASFPGANGKIAFERSDDIWTMDADGTNQVNLTNTAALDRSPAWSPDGNKIAFVSPYPGNVFVMNADGTGRTQVLLGSPPVGVYELAWSSDGQKLALGDCCPSDLALETINIDGTGRVKIRDSEDGIDWPDWSPAGNKIAFIDYAPCQPSGALLTTNPDGSGAFQVSGPCPGFESPNYESPSWSPDTQRIAIARSPCPACAAEEIWTIKPDGTDLQQVTSPGTSPVWSPDGSKIAFDNGDIHVMNANGTGITPIAAGDDPDWQRVPTSGADVFTTLTDAPDPIKAGDELHYTASAKNLVGPDNASGVTLTVNLPASVFYVSATPTQGSCSQAAGVVTCNFGALAKGASASVDIDVEPRPVIANTVISASASVTANENDPVPGNNSASTTTTVQPGAHVRPKGATPLRVPLVPSYRQCGSEATLQHGAPLSYPSCGNPQLSSGYLTFGTPDNNGKGANSIGSVIYSVVGESPINPNNGDQADVKVDFSLTDVRNKSDLTDYTGELQVTSQLGITDRDNGAGGFTSATVMDIPFPFFATCAPTVSTTIGAACSVHTSADAVVPGSVKESKRAIWALGQVQVLDGGADGQAATNDNTLLAVQGVFTP